MGRVLLAALPESELRGVELATSRRTGAAVRAEIAQVRERGWALVDQELEPGLRSIAAPIRDRDGAVVAAINVSTSVSTTSPSADELTGRPLEALLATAAAISADLAHLG
jgi:IclR family pca regulon transcriptional regulator